MSPVSAPSSSNLYVGAAIVLCERLDVNGVGLGMNHMGNVDTASLSFTVDEITKRSSMNKSKGIYDRLVRHVDPVLKLSASEYTIANIEKHLLGDSAVLVQAATAVTAEAVTPTTIPGHIFQTKKLGPVTAVAVKFGVTTGVLGTDYEIVDATIGLIRILPTTILTGAVTIDYTPTAYTSSTGPTVISGATSPQITARFKLITDPPRGTKSIIDIWKAQISPDGAHDYITEEYGAMSFNATVLDDSANHPTTPFFNETKF